MAEFNYLTNLAPQIQPMNIGGMLDLARGVQAYQQAQELNPLAVQKAQMEVEQARQINPLAVRQKTAETQVAEQTAKPKIEQAGSEAQTAAAQAQKNQLESLRAFLTNARRETTHLINKDNLTLEDIKKHYKQNIVNAVDDPKLREQIYNQAIAGLPKDASPNALRQFLIRDLTGAVSSETQLEKLFPAAGMTSAGNQVVPTATGNPLLSMTGAPGTQVGPAIGTNLAPQVFANPITGQPTVLGGGGPAPTPAPSFQQQFLQAQQKQAQTTQPAPQTGVMPARPVPGMPVQPQGGGQLTQGANESPANFNARVAQTQTQYAGALDQYNNPQSQLGHIPTIQTINNNILNLLKDKDVNTGAIADYLANKTNKGALNSKEQELTKYLEQRIQNLSPRTDRDAASKQSAYGSFNLDKEALKEIVRNDNTWLTTQDLYAKGILHNGANPTNPQNPNYGGVSNFTNNFVKYANNPTLMRYISLVGDKQKVHLDDDDKSAFGKLVGKMTPEQRAALEQQRQEVLQLVNPRGR